MLYRRDAIAFLVPNGHDSLSQEVKALLFSTKHAKADYCPNYRDDESYNDEPVLWINNGDLDAVLQNSDFWNYLLDGTIKSYKNFNIRTKSDIIDTPNDGFSNDNSMAIFMSDKSDLLYSGAEYLPNSEYQSDFVLTAEYIDNKPYIKDWIRDRGLQEDFDMSKTVGELKEDIKIYYNLIGAEDV